MWMFKINLDNIKPKDRLENLESLIFNFVFASFSIALVKSITMSYLKISLLVLYAFFMITFAKKLNFLSTIIIDRFFKRLEINIEKMKYNRTFMGISSSLLFHILVLERIWFKIEGLFFDVILYLALYLAKIWKKIFFYIIVISGVILAKYLTNLSWGEIIGWSLLAIVCNVVSTFIYQYIQRKKK